MCRRFSLNSVDTKDFLSRKQLYSPLTEELETIPEGQALILQGERQNYKLLTAKFGFYGRHKLIVNARIETVERKPIFASSFASRRCIVLASKFYEFDRNDLEQTFISRDGLIFLAGIYQYDHFVILTQKANEAISFYHSRMPIALAEESIDAYLNLKASDNMSDEVMKLKRSRIEAVNASDQLSLF